MTEDQQANTCSSCMTVMAAEFEFCGKCGADLRQVGGKHWVIHLLDAEGEVEATGAIMPGTQIIGANTDADILVEGDRAVSPRHVLVRLQDAQLSLEDQGSRNGLFIPLTGASPIGHNDLIRAGGQLFRFQLIERLGVEPVVALPHPAFGPSKPAWGRLLRYNRHGQVAATRLLENESFCVGRRSGDWALKRARTMSGEHFSVARSDEDQILVNDLNSRNGTFVEIRGAVSAQDGSRFLVGDRIVRVNQVSLGDYHEAIGTADDLEIHEAVSIDASEINEEETLVGIPEDIVEAALEESIPPVGSEVPEVVEVLDDVVEAEAFAEPEADPGAEEPVTQTSDGEPDEAAEVAEAPPSEPTGPVEPEEQVEASSASPAQSSPPQAEALEASEEPVEAETETVAVQPVDDVAEEYATEIDEEGPGDWAAAALVDFQDDP